MSEIYINCRELTKSFGSRSLFQNLSFSIFSKDRVGLIGPNGSGKTTLLKILAKEELPNTGEISIKRGLKIGYVPQVCTFGDQTLFEALLEGFAEDDLRADYEKEQIIRYWLSKMGFKEFQGRASALSGGWRKRLSIAKELLKEPDLLLLDEPTNHLDLEGILWLEEFFRKESISFVLVSHDRYFLQNMVNRIIEINPVYPQGLFETSGSYAEFLERKEQFLQGQLRQERSIATQVRKESNWLHTSPKARTCKSKSRVEDAYEILDDFSQIQMRNTEKKAKIDFLATDRETQKLLTAKNISKEIGGRPLFCHLDFILSPGKKIGLMGPNGSGKTTLLKMIAGEMAPDQGTIKRADALQIVYFDQHRAQLPSTITLREALSPKGDFVSFRGKMIHVNGWCRRFLFSPDLLDMPLLKLSGGERARISIAHLMLQPADILLLDEPTNDLDVATLETLEESLLEFPGALVLITHDRCMLDRVCNSLLSLGDIEQNTFFADYRQWELAQKKETPDKKKTQEKKTETSSSKKGLTFAEKKEYDQLEGKILRLEEGLKSLKLSLEQEEIGQEPEKLHLICSQVALAENQIEQLYLRWGELEKKIDLKS